jgi:hypothetical protein
MILNESLINHQNVRDFSFRLRGIDHAFLKFINLSIKHHASSFSCQRRKLTNKK